MVTFQEVLSKGFKDGPPACHFCGWLPEKGSPYVNLILYQNVFICGKCMVKAVIPKKCKNCGIDNKGPLVKFCMNCGKKFNERR